MPEIKKESMLASASIDRTPRVGIVLSSFKGGEEHDGTPLAGLSSPRPVDAELTDSELDALLRKAIELSRRGRRRGGEFPIDGVGPEDWVVVRITPATDVRLVRSLLGILIAARQGKRFTIADDGPAPAGYDGMLKSLAASHRGLRFEYVNLDSAPYLTAPAVRRTFAARNPDGVYAIPKVIRECDTIIAVAPLDVGIAPTYMAIAPRAAYGGGREKLLALGDKADVLCDLYLHHPPAYAILGGPSQVRHNLVIAGRNAVSVDAVGAAVMGLDVKKIALLDKLEARGFGVADPDSIWTRGNEIEEARRPFPKPAAWSTL
jgi:hypothetical protein